MSNESINLEQGSNEVEIPFVITWDMKQQLADLGWNSERRSQLNPEEAHDIIRNQKTFQENSGAENVEAGLQAESRAIETLSEHAQVEQLEGTIEDTKNQLDDVRSRLGLSADVGEPHSIQVARDTLEKMGAEKKEPLEITEIDPDGDYDGLPSTPSDKPGGIDIETVREQESDGKEQSEDKQESEAGYENSKKFELLQEIRKNALDGLKKSKANLASACGKYFEALEAIRKNLAKNFGEISEIDSKKLSDSEIFDELVDQLTKQGIITAYNIASLEKLLSLDPNMLSPEALRNIGEETSLERLAEIRDELDEYFNSVDNSVDKLLQRSETMTDRLKGLTDEKDLEYKKSELLAVADISENTNDIKNSVLKSPEIRKNKNVFSGEQFVEETIARV